MCGELRCDEHAHGGKEKKKKKKKRNEKHVSNRSYVESKSMAMYVFCMLHSVCRNDRISRAETYTIVTQIKRVLSFCIAMSSLFCRGMMVSFETAHHHRGC